MEPVRLLQRRAIQRLFYTCPLHQSFRSRLQQIPQQPFRTRPVPQNIFRRSVHTQRPGSRTFRQGTTRSTHTTRRYNSTSAATSDENLSFSQRLKKLTREYGWSALGVYLTLSALDFPFCFLAVKLLGTDRIGRWEHVIVSYINSVIPWPLTQGEPQEADEASGHVTDAIGPEAGGGRILEAQDHGNKEAEGANIGANASTCLDLPTNRMGFY